MPLEKLDIDQAHFYRQTVEQITTAARFPKTPDKTLSDWLQNSAAAVSQGSLATQELLEKLSAEVPQISSATACVSYAGSVSSLSKSIAEWADEIDPSFSHFATHVFADVDSQQVGCAAVAVERLRRFSPESLNAGEKSFYSLCRLCKPLAHRHHRTDERGSSSLVPALRPRLRTTRVQARRQGVPGERTAHGMDAADPRPQDGHQARGDALPLENRPQENPLRQGPRRRARQPRHLAARQRDLEMQERRL